MHFSTIAIAVFATSAYANTCERHSGQIIPTTTVQADDIDASLVPGICGGLWDNLKQFADCIGVGSPSCAAQDGGLHWTFTNGDSCNGGDIEATWWDATKNAYGSITCVDID